MGAIMASKTIDFKYFVPQGQAATCPDEVVRFCSSFRRYCRSCCRGRIHAALPFRLYDAGRILCRTYMSDLHSLRQGSIPLPSYRDFFNNPLRGSEIRGAPSVDFFTNPLPAAKSREPIERLLVNKPLKGVFGR